VDVDAFVAIACDELQVCTGGGGRSLRARAARWWVGDIHRMGRGRGGWAGGGGKRRRGGSWVVEMRSKTIRRKTFKTWTSSSDASSPYFQGLTNPL